MEVRPQAKVLHVIVVSLASAGLALAQNAKPACGVTGSIFGIDPISNMLLIKDGGGYFKNAKLSPTTKFTKLAVSQGGSPSQMRVTELNVGDLVCVQNDGEAARQVSVVPRADVHRAQLAFVAQWQRDSVFGTVSSIDIAKRSLVVAPAPPSVEKGPVQVSLPPTARFRMAPPTARRIVDAVSFQIEDLKAGDSVYIRGSRPAGEQVMLGTLVLKGGYRAIVGTLTEVKVLDGVLQVHEFGSGRMLRVKVTPNEVYRTTETLTDPMRVQTQSGIVLVPVSLADLQTGDAIMIIGRATPENPDGEGLAAITKFGTLGVLPNDPPDRMTWFLAK
jgi:hypothetical protein